MFDRPARERQLSCAPSPSANSLDHAAATIFNLQSIFMFCQFNLHLNLVDNLLVISNESTFSSSIEVFGTILVSAPEQGSWDKNNEVVLLHLGCWWWSFWFGQWQLAEIQLTFLEGISGPCSFEVERLWSPCQSIVRSVYTEYILFGKILYGIIEAILTVTLLDSCSRKIRVISSWIYVDRS